MQKQSFKQILIDQKEESQRIFQEQEVLREKEEYAKRVLKDSLIKVIIGPRRSGKSFLAHRILKDTNYGYVNFDDERLIGVRAHDLNNILGSLQEINPECRYFLFDEIQNVDGWELFANRLARSGYNLVITGSNAKLLSRELATHLTGRHILIELFPFSFKEFLQSRGILVKSGESYSTKKISGIKRALDEYFQIGGFPELNKVALPYQYLQDLYSRIVTRDIATRYRIKYIKTLKEIALYALSHAGSKMTYHKIKNIFEIKSVHTIKNYFAYLEEAYLIFQLYPFSFKLKERIAGARKVYGVDIGLIRSVCSSSSPNDGRMMENAVFLELKRQGREIYFYNDAIGSEVDFIVKTGQNITQLIQVCLSLDDIETREREFKSLIKGSNYLRCNNLLVITKDAEFEENIKGKVIKGIPLWKWLLE